jgi:hypothetical protein
MPVEKNSERHFESVRSLMLLLVKKANETDAVELSTFEVIFRLSMKICDQYGLGWDAKTVVESPVPLAARLAA